MFILLETGIETDRQADKQKARQTDWLTCWLVDLLTGNSNHINNRVTNIECSSLLEKKVQKVVISV